jgi:hypothetical protein
LLSLLSFAILVPSFGKRVRVTPEARQTRPGNAQEVRNEGNHGLGHIAKRSDSRDRAIERNIMLEALCTCILIGGIAAKTAEALKIGYRALIYKVRDAGLCPDAER